MGKNLNETATNDNAPVPAPTEMTDNTPVVPVDEIGAPAKKYEGPVIWCSVHEGRKATHWYQDLNGGVHIVCLAAVPAGSNRKLFGHLPVPKNAGEVVSTPLEG